ncbi:MAG TPA: ribonuclease H [Gaiellaceae bacterium]|jgi:ribonuclease HI
MAGPPQIIPDENALTVFTDGSSLPAPRRGGLGVHFVHTDSVGNESYHSLDEAGYLGATNNQMELLAVITALKVINSGRLPSEMFDGITKIEICTDSQYVTNNLSAAIYQWPTNKWHTRDGAPVLNADLWKELIREYKKGRQAFGRVEISWGKGHSSSNQHNKTADKLAKRSARKPTRTLDGAAVVRRKKTTQVTKPGSVEMRGQRLTIRIVGAEPVPLQPQLSRYRYEVMSRASPFFGAMDFAYSEDPRLRPHHTYEVRMGVEPGYPKIARVFREKLEPPESPGEVSADL